MDDPFRRPTMGSAIFYRDPFAALNWLEKAFGFARAMVITDDQGGLAHSEMRFGDGYIMIGADRERTHASPLSLDGRITQKIHVLLEHGIDEHFARAIEAGAISLMPPTDQFYGDRAYIVKDPEGHHWTFAQPVRAVSREEAEQASGLKIQGWG